jgi:glycosyltransferase involved in cell wall biosynthesis
MNRKLCLNMIVRDEAHIVTEALESVSPFIDYWVIVDTGSKDETPALIRDYFSALGIPGELHFREWRNFGFNRTEALQLCSGKATYAWVIDADDRVVGQPDFSSLDKDVYSLLYGTGFCHWRQQLFRASLPWRYRGAVHEYAECSVPVTHGRLNGHYHIESRTLGSRNLDPKKYERDIALLQEELRAQPDCPRSTFYLAQSYFDNGDWTQSRRWYRKRVALAGWSEEVFYSKLRIAQCLEKQDGPFDELCARYLDCWEYRPSRAEPLYHLSRLCRQNERFHSGYLYGSWASRIPVPENDVLFIDTTVYKWRIDDELSLNAYYTGHYEESASLCRKILRREDIPAADRERIIKNLDFAEARSGSP